MRPHRLTYALIMLGLLAAIAFCLPSGDPWEDIRPWWGERPGAESHSFTIRHEKRKLNAHLLRGAESWVEEQKQRFDCREAMLNDTERALLAALGREAEPCTVWSSAQRYDIAHYQAVRPTFICFNTGDCLFYLNNPYATQRDIIPPPCPKLPRLSENEVPAP